jgi:2-dehydropantoate 2-reductase
MARRMGAVPNLGSTLQSLKRGQLTEIDYLNGAVVAQAEAVGRTAPVNQAIADAVHEVERTRRFFTPAELAARAAAAQRVSTSR